VSDKRKYLRQELAQYDRYLRAIDEGLHIHSKELQACDRLICKVNAGLDPSQIKPVEAHQGRYGKRGQLGVTVLQTLMASYPSSLTSHEVAHEVSDVLHLKFISPHDKSSWFKNSLRWALKDLVQNGLVERLHAPISSSAGHGRWRWKPPAGAQTPAELADLAEAAGIGTRQAPDDASEDA
jgi:hypothetical protein